MDWEQIQLKYGEATPEIKALFDSEELINSIDKVTNKYSFSKPERNRTVSMYGSRVLGAIKSTDFIDFLLTFREVSDVQNIMSELDADSGFATPKKTATVETIRTMASDSKHIGYSSTEETTYTSTQSALINESK